MDPVAIEPLAARLTPRGNPRTRKDLASQPEVSQKSDARHGLGHAHASFKVGRTQVRRWQFLNSLWSDDQKWGAYFHEKDEFKTLQSDA
jgi:hypothetical protein